MIKQKWTYKYYKKSKTYQNTENNERTVNIPVRKSFQRFEGKFDVKYSYNTNKTNNNNNKTYKHFKYNNYKQNNRHIKFDKKHSFFFKGKKHNTRFKTVKKKRIGIFHLISSKIKAKKHQFNYKKIFYKTKNQIYATFLKYNISRNLFSLEKIGYRKFILWNRLSSTFKFNIIKFNFLSRNKSKQFLLGRRNLKQNYLSYRRFFLLYSYLRFNPDNNRLFFNNLLFSKNIFDLHIVKSEHKRSIRKAKFRYIYTRWEKEFFKRSLVLLFLFGLPSFWLKHLKKIKRFKVNRNQFKKKIRIALNKRQVVLNLRTVLKKYASQHVFWLLTKLKRKKNRYSVVLRQLIVPLKVRIKFIYSKRKIKILTPLKVNIKKTALRLLRYHKVFSKQIRMLFKTKQLKKFVKLKQKKNTARRKKVFLFLLYRYNLIRYFKRHTFVVNNRRFVVRGLFKIRRSKVYNFGFLNKFNKLELLVNGESKTFRLKVKKYVLKDPVFVFINNVFYKHKMNRSSFFFSNKSDEFNLLYSKAFLYKSIKNFFLLQRYLKFRYNVLRSLVIRFKTWLFSFLKCDTTFLFRILKVKLTRSFLRAQLLNKLSPSYTNFSSQISFDKFFKKNIGLFDFTKNKIIWRLNHLVCLRKLNRQSLLLRYLSPLKSLNLVESATKLMRVEINFTKLLKYQNNSRYFFNVMNLFSSTFVNFVLLRKIYLFVWRIGFNLFTRFLLNANLIGGKLLNILIFIRRRKNIYDQFDYNTFTLFKSCFDPVEIFKSYGVLNRFYHSKAVLFHGNFTFTDFLFLRKIRAFHVFDRKFVDETNYLEFINCSVKKYFSGLYKLLGVSELFKKYNLFNVSLNRAAFQIKFKFNNIFSLVPNFYKLDFISQDISAVYNIEDKKTLLVDFFLSLHRVKNSRIFWGDRFYFRRIYFISIYFPARFKRNIIHFNEKFKSLLINNKCDLTTFFDVEEPVHDEIILTGKRLGADFISNEIFKTLLYNFLRTTSFSCVNSNLLLANDKTVSDVSNLQIIDSEMYWALNHSAFNVGFFSVMKKILRTEKFTVDFLLSIPQRLSSFIKRRDIYQSFNFVFKNRNWFLTEVRKQTDRKFALLAGKAVGVIYQKALRNYYIIFDCGFRNYLSIPLLASLSHEENTALTLCTRSKNSVAKRTQLLYSDFFKNVLKGYLSKFKQFSKYKPVFNSRFRLWLDYYVQHQPYWSQLKTTLRKQPLEHINKLPSSFLVKKTFEFLYSRAYGFERDGVLGSVNVFKYTNSSSFENGKTWSVNKLSKYFLRQNVVNVSLRQTSNYILLQDIYYFTPLLHHFTKSKANIFFFLLRKFAWLKSKFKVLTLNSFNMQNFLLFLFVLCLIRQSVLGLLNISFFLKFNKAKRHKF